MPRMFLKMPQVIQQNLPHIYPSEWVTYEYETFHLAWRHIGRADVAIRSENGCFSYIKNRDHGDLSRKVTEDMIYIILSSSEIHLD